MRAQSTGQRPDSPDWLTGDAPAAAIEIATDRVTVVGLARAASGAVVQGWATEALPAGAVVPALTSLNVIDTVATGEALKRALARAGVKASRVGLVIPDLAAKVSLVPFEKVPARQEDLKELITWQVRKAVPFRLEDAQMSFVPGAAHGDAGRTYVVTLARRDIVQQYEEVAAAAGVHAGVVDISSFNVINAILRGQVSPGDLSLPPAPSPSDWLLVSTTADSQTLAIMRGEALVFFRNRTIEGDETLPDLVHQTAMYYEDRLQGAGFARVVLAGGAAWSGDAVRQSLTDRLHAPVTTIEPRQVATFTGAEFQALPPAAADALLAPLGLLLRESAA
ncbi:MAG: pilus assembly protein PilM [Acidobacteriota bacterium]|nr:pilus assembly protein PilM [Acidobacteriota bacterium]